MNGLHGLGDRWVAWAVLLMVLSGCAYQQPPTPEGLPQSGPETIVQKNGGEGPGINPLDESSSAEDAWASHGSLNVSDAAPENRSSPKNGTPAPIIPSGGYALDRHDEDPEKRGCQGSGPVNLTAPPMDTDKIGYIAPMGLMIEGHVTPIDHQYYIEKPGLEPYEVRATANGVVTRVEAMPGSNNDDYRIIIHHTCTLFSIYIHVNKLSPRLLGAVGPVVPGRSENPELEVDAGEVIAGITNRYRSFDYSLHNEESNLSGFIVPDHYAGEPWKIHTVDPYDYFAEPLRTELLARNLRSSEPRGGKIDYDKEGRLIGNWFRENTGGYRSNAEPYWKTHFAMAPNAYDPSHTILSLGDFDGSARQFSIRGNLPDPSEITPSSGIVKYELMETEYFSGGSVWDRNSWARNLEAGETGKVQGVVLVQMIEDRKIRLEVFPGKTASQVSGFGGGARVYER